MWFTLGRLSSVSVDCIFLGSYLFLLSCPICYCAIVLRTLLYFVLIFLWRQLQCLLFHFWFCCCCCAVTKSCLTLATAWTAACQASLSFTISLTLLKLMSIESVMPSNYLILCHPLAINLSKHWALFQWINSSYNVAKLLELQLRYQSFWWIFRINFF